jgi:hypothetical protein
MAPLHGAGELVADLRGAVECDMLLSADMRLLGTGRTQNGAESDVDSHPAVHGLAEEALTGDA